MNNILFALKQSAVCDRKLFLSEKSHIFRPPPIIGEFFYDLGGRKSRVYMVFNSKFYILNVLVVITSHLMDTSPVS